MIIPSLNEASWLRRCLPTVRTAAEGIDAEVIVAAIDSSDDVEDVVCDFAPLARLVRCENRGFAHANNVALATTAARYVLFLNPDTEVVAGDFASLLSVFDQHPELGLAGVRQLTPEGDIYPTMRRFTTPTRTWATAFGIESWAPRSRLTQRVAPGAAYDRKASCDWTIGSFMMVRREALLSAGWMDERFFFNSEEEDLCRRIRGSGWDVVHLPAMTIVHHAGKRGRQPRFEAQATFAKLQYARKNLSRGAAQSTRLALVAHHAVRLLAAAIAGDHGGRAVALAGLKAALGLGAPPFAVPPPTALPVKTGG